MKSPSTQSMVNYTFELNEQLLVYKENHRPILLHYILFHDKSNDLNPFVILEYLYGKCPIHKEYL